jgi:hypothetical protein
MSSEELDDKALTRPILYTNWSNYNAALRKRWSLLIWVGKMHEKPSCDGVCRASLIEIIMVI